MLPPPRLLHSHPLKKGRSVMLRPPRLLRSHLSSGRREKIFLLPSFSRRDGTEGDGVVHVLQNWIEPLLPGEVLTGLA